MISGETKTKDFYNEIDKQTGKQRIAILKALHIDLCEIFQTQDENLAARDRSRYIIALKRISDAFQELGFSYATWRDLNELSDALRDLEHGTIRHFLAPAARFSKPLDPTDITVARAWVSIGVDMMISKGISRKDACRWVATNYSFIGKHLSKGNNGWSVQTIENWHYLFANKRVKQRVAQELFDNRLNACRELNRLYPTDKEIEYYATFANVMFEAQIAAERADPRSLRVQRSIPNKSKPTGMPKPVKQPTGAYSDL